MFTTCTTRLEDSKTLVSIQIAACYVWNTVICSYCIHEFIDYFVEMPFVSCITLLFTFFSSTCKKISVRILVRFLFIYCVYSCFISPFTFFSSLDFEGLDSQRVGSPSPPLPHQVRIFLTKIFAFVYIRYFCFNHCLLFLPFSLGEGDTNWCVYCFRLLVLLYVVLNT